MNPPGHLLLGVVAGGGGWLLTGDLLPALALGAGAVLIDADHALDAWRGGVLFDYRACRQYFDHELPPRMLLPLHYWELWSAVLAATWWFHLPLPGAFAAGALLHLLADQCTNPVRRPGYFLWYRWRTGFSYAGLLADAELARRRALAGSPPAARAAVSREPVVVPDGPR